jgi:hypothetical protein
LMQQVKADPYHPLHHPQIERPNLYSTLTSDWRHRGRSSRQAFTGHMLPQIKRMETSDCPLGRPTDSMEKGVAVVKARAHPACKFLREKAS